MRELAEQIDSHVKVIDVDNSTSNVPKGPNAPEINPVPTPPNFWKGFLYHPYSCTRPCLVNALNR